MTFYHAAGRRTPAHCKGLAADAADPVKCRYVRTAVRPVQCLRAALQNQAEASENIAHCKSMLEGSKSSLGLSWAAFGSHETSKSTKDAPRVRPRDAQERSKVPKNEPDRPNPLSKILPNQIFQAFCALCRPTANLH